ncbi:MAG: hypothetical protein KatS3mg038_3189 [Candidatus Kapaibacterium sp.]|nr:MAG: hypothetical protein KatS3mg038_3189 [Candidatus Kapabacteria bacterium]
MTQKQDSSVGLEEIMEAYEQMRYARERVEQLRDELKEARRELAQAESQLHGLFEQLQPVTRQAQAPASVPVVRRQGTIGASHHRPYAAASYIRRAIRRRCHCVAQQASLAS